MMRHWFRLLRIAGLTTLLSNMLAVLVTTRLSTIDLAREAVQNAPALFWVLLGSGFIYLAGMIWNDVADAERDADIAPQRPIPSGRITYPTAWIAAMVCTILALLCASQLGWRGFYTATVVITLALLYNFGAKSIPWLGSVVMASTRASHACFALLILGPEHFDVTILTIAAWLGNGSLPSGAGSVGYPGLLALYIFGITLISECEHRRSYRWEILVGAACLAAALGAAIWMGLSSHLLRDALVERQFTQAALIIGASAGLAIWACWRLATTLIPTIRLARQSLIGPFMVRALSGIILFDALIILAFRPELVPLALLLLIPFAILGRLGRMD